MQSIPSLFDFNGQTIRTVTRDDQIWFVARDVAAALGYTNPNESVRYHCKNVRLVAGSDLLFAGNHAGYSHTDRIRRHQIINEADLYRLVLRSNLPAAEKFADWICDEVLPTLRRDGTYTMPGSIPPAWVAAPSVDLLALKSCFTKNPATNLTASESQMVRSLASAFTKAGLPEPLDGHKVTPLLARVVADRLLLSKRTSEIERRVETLITADMD